MPSELTSAEGASAATADINDFAQAMFFDVGDGVIGLSVVVHAKLLG